MQRIFFITKIHIIKYQHLGCRQHTCLFFIIDLVLFFLVITFWCIPVWQHILICFVPLFRAEKKAGHLPSHAIFPFSVCHILLLCQIRHISQNLSFTEYAGFPQNQFYNRHNMSNTAP